MPWMNLLTSEANGTVPHQPPTPLLVNGGVAIGQWPNPFDKWCIIYQFTNKRLTK